MIRLPELGALDVVVQRNAFGREKGSGISCDSRDLLTSLGASAIRNEDFEANLRIECTKRRLCHL